MNISVRESLELLIRCEGWQRKTFASAQEFLDRPAPILLDNAAGNFGVRPYAIDPEGEQ